MWKFMSHCFFDWLCQFMQGITFLLLVNENGEHLGVVDQIMFFKVMGCEVVVIVQFIFLCVVCFLLRNFSTCCFAEGWHQRHIGIQLYPWQGWHGAMVLGVIEDSALSCFVIISIV